jgi:5-formyltetrahydrofolate cyclo-ligase
LEFALCNENTQFKKNSLNILEPISEEIIQLGELNAVIVPLRAFNRNFQRLGFGGGFYDTTFSEITQPEFIGLAYEFQFIKKLKLEDFDIKFDVVFTDKQLLQKSLVT